MTQVFHDVACPACGCVCDDIGLRVESGHIVDAERACALGAAWFECQSADSDAPVRIDGAAATFEDGIHRAAEILAESRAPLVYGLADTSTDGIRAAVELAETLGGTVDTVASLLETAAIKALQTVGMSTATLGEIRNRADLVLYWRADPLATHPRHLERFVDPNGMFVLKGRDGRQVIVLDAARTATAQRADQFIQVESDGDFELLRHLRAAIGGLNFAGDAEEAAALAQKMKACRYGVIFFGDGLNSANVIEIARLVRELNVHTRFVALPMVNAGATQTLTWLTGCPCAINFAAGYPRYSPEEYSAELLLTRGEVDAVVLVGAACRGQLPPTAEDALARLPVIALHGANEACPAAVSFATAIYGLHRPGTAYRMDGVPIPLRRVLNSPLPSDAEILTSIQQECARVLASF